MQERVNEIIELLMREIAAHPDPVGENLEKLSEKLLKKGYTEREIRKAVECVLSQLGEHPRHSSRLSSRSKAAFSLRLLNPEEMHFFTPKAYGYLIELQAWGIIKPLQVEQIIERCLIMGITHIDIEEIKTIVSQILLGEELSSFETDSIYYPGNDWVN